jgi:hypothetical protein
MTPPIKTAPKNPTKAAGENLTRYFISNWGLTDKDDSSMAQNIRAHW